jgi:hypothetical protein
MPWTSADATKYKKDLSKKQSKKWASIANGALESCVESGGSEKDCATRAIKIANSRFSEAFNPVMPKDFKVIGELKKFQYKKETPKDAIDGHVHTAAYDDDGNGATDIAGTFPHHHSVWNFKLQSFYYRDPVTGSEYTSAHPGSLAFEEKPKEPVKKNASDLGECEMEIFRVGTHNGDEYTAKDLEEIAANFQKLKDEVRPKLKITHREGQEALAGLASYGDVTEVFTKDVEGEKRLFAKVANVPKQVLEWIKGRRFPERSIEIYPEFKLGVDEKSPIYRNVLKAIALLGSEMPAVTGMAPVVLEECLECQGTVCFREDLVERNEVPADMEMGCRILEELLKV